MMIGGLKTQFSQGVYEASTVQKEEIGTLRILADGRKYRYVQAGTGGLAPGKAAAGSVAVANHINLAVPAASEIGALQLSITVGATAVTADQYLNGYLQINDATGEGYQYKIVGNTACDASGTTVVMLEEAIRVALVASTSEVSLIPNPYAGAVHTTVEESLPVGVACHTVAASSYGWVQSGGPAVALVAGTPAVGTMLTLSATSGALAAMAATLDVDMPTCAIAYGTVGVAGEYKPVFLKLD